MLPNIKNGNAVRVACFVSTQKSVYKKKRPRPGKTIGSTVELYSLALLGYINAFFKEFFNSLLFFIGSCSRLDMDFSNP